MPKHFPQMAQAHRKETQTHPPPAADVAGGNDL